MNKRLAASLIIGLAIITFIFAGQQKQTDLTEQQIKSEIEKANYCSVKEDCTRIFPDVCPFSCNIFVNAKETSRVDALLHSYVKTEQNSKMCSLLGACAPPTSAECKNNKCEAIYKTKTGIAGTVTVTTGDCMPGEPSKISPCTQTKVSRAVYIREPATMANMDTVPNFVYLKTKTNLVAQTTSDANGYFEAELPAGTYSVFVEDEGKEYCNHGGGLGEECQVTVTDSGLAEFNININNKAAY